MPRDFEKQKQVVLSSVLNPSSADIKYAVILYGNKPTLVAEFQDFENSLEFTKFTKLLKKDEDGRLPEKLFEEKGRPNARRLVVVFFRGSAVLSKEMMSRWNKRFVNSNILFVPVVFGTISDGVKFMPLTPQGIVVTIDPNEDHTKKGKEISQEIVKGNYNV